MGYIKLRFAKEVNQKDYNEKYNPGKTNEPYFSDGLNKSWGLMQYFTKLEEGMSRLIVIGLGLDNPAPWKEIAYQIGKTFSAAQQVEMIKDLVDREALILTEDSIFPLPTELINKKTELDFFKSCRLAMEFRNELAHNGIIIFVRQKGTEYYHLPMVGMDNPRSKNGSDIFKPVNIAAKSRVDDKGQTTHLSFQDWAFRLSNSVPLYFGPPVLKPGNPLKNRVEFINYHKEKLSKRLESENERKLKKIDKFNESIKKYE